MARNSKSRTQKKQEINDHLAKMKFVKFLGKGSFGSVHLMQYPKPDGSMFYNAMKISAINRHDSLDREFQILSKLKGCPNIVQCFDQNILIKDINGNKVYKMVMEYASAGTLTSFMKRNKNLLSDTTIRDFTRMILQGLVSVHSHGYVHCDLKPDNLLLFPRCSEEGEYDLKISDFGMSTKAGEVSEYWRVDSPFVGTPVYMSPEIIKDGVVEKTLDLWSLGCVVWEMYTGKQPWSELESIDIRPTLLANAAPEIPDTVPCDARKFLETCFARMPEERGSASELLLHPFLTGEDKTSKKSPFYFTISNLGSLILYII